MKKIFLNTIVSFGFLAFLFSPFVVEAVQNPSNKDPLGTQYGQETGLSKADPRIIVGRIIQVGLGLLGVVALVLIVYGGFTIMTAAGNEEKIQKGKNILFYSVIGLLIILASYSITNFVLSSLYTATQGSVYNS